ncbi:hypothetical protein [Streptomyces sp. NPDC052015]|uniref:hypothetical protein n=1 Tax=Streptomyces sp. NPDC052015 TaxID=3154755 RepID=UPI003417914B
MTFHYTDPDGHRIEATPGYVAESAAVSFMAWNAYGDTIRVDIPVARVEELIAGIRDTARQAAIGPNPQHIGNQANAEDCPACIGTNPPYPFLCPGGQP